MAHDIRLWFAVDGARRRIRTGLPSDEAATRLSRMLDVPPELVLQLATVAEQACTVARAHYGRTSDTSPTEKPDAQ
jgi:hypothetical protein